MWCMIGTRKEKQSRIVGADVFPGRESGRQRPDVFVYRRC